ncbi:TAF3 [Acanthosepion pharaonis]|uniref:TAF3 n=1 Tax=Acanthosepion pharaonis TaxID=158019 RepID=A0A812CLQ6_ACAPH|nr:TAF3 [Sepia pharaonis]
MSFCIFSPSLAQLIFSFFCSFSFSLLGLLRWSKMELLGRNFNYLYNGIPTHYTVMLLLLEIFTWTHFVVKMASEYCRQILRVVVAQICQHLGWHSTHATPLEVLTDVLERYILDVSRTTHQYAERYGRTEVNLDDLGLAFRTLGISLSELDDYIKHVEALPFGKDVAAFPKPKKSNLCFPNPKSREIYHREEHVSDYLPYMFPGMEDEMEVEEVSPTPSVPAASQPGSTTPVTVPNNQEIGTPENLADTSPVLRGEKRSLNSPSDGAPMYKRQRLSNNNLPEEAGHSQYEMTSVKMSVSGLLTPIKSQGKLPDPSPPVMFPPVEKKKELPPKDIPKKTEPEKDTNTSKIEDKENITTKKPKENDITIKRAGMMNSKNKELTPVLPPPPPPPKERKKPVARKKKKDQIAKVEKSTLETIDECINSVLRNMRAAYELEKQKEQQEAIARDTIAEDAMVAATTAAVVSAAVTDTVVISSIFTPTKPSLASTPTPKKTDKKGDKKLDKKLEKKKRNLMKEKTKKLKIKALKQKGKENAEVREKLKEKIKSKSQRQNSSSSEKTPPVRPDKFTAEEWKIYDFDGSPPGSHPNSLHQHDSSPFSSSPHSIRSCVSPSMDSLTLLSTAASAASNVPMHLPPSMPLSLPQASLSSQDSDIPSQLKMKIGLAKGGKGKIKSKVKSKDKEHKKDKKDKKKDKEKKKKNKEKEEKKQKERLKEEKYQCVVVSQAEQISTPLSVPRLKLNIKLGGSIPVAVTPDTDTKRAPSNTPTNIKRDIPSSPLPHRPEIPRLVIRTPVPVMSPPVIPAKNEKSTAKVTKPTPKAKAALKKKPVVKKPAVKREKPTPKKSAKVIAPEPVNVPSICKIEALNAPPQIPQFLPTVSASKHSEIGNVNVADMLMPEALLAVVKQEKFSPPKPFIKSQKMTAAAREKLTQKEKQVLLKTQTLPVSTAFGLRKTEEKINLKTSKVNQNKTKAAKATKTTAKLTGKNEKVCIRGKSEKATAKAKAEKIKAEKAALEMAATALAKVEKPVIMKDRPIMKVNKPPNKLGRPPKIEIPPSPPPTIPYPSSPPCIPASIGGTLPIAQPIGHHHFTPLLANIPTPVPTIPQPYPITVSTPKANQVVPKVAVTAKSTPKGKGARAHAISLPKAQKLNSAKALLASVKETQSDSHVTCPSNLLTPMPLTSSPALSEKLMIPNKSSPIPSPLSSPLHMISGLPPDNSLIALSRDIVSANIPMDSSASFSLPISDIIGSSENSMSLGKRPVQRSVFAETVGTFMDENGQKIWICPGCKLPDDGSPMIGCDGCDDWYHWPCVNIREEPPSEEQWFCQKCLVKTKNKPKRKRRRKAKAY